MKLKIYQVDAFTDKLFSGNPAAVVRLKEWLSDATLQNIASENNLAETAFFLPSSREGSEMVRYHLRWFTPENEVDLCGHATVASAFVLFQYENLRGDEISFESKSGILTVRKSGDLYTLNFPSYTISPDEATNDVLSAIGKVPVEVFKMKNDLLLVYHDQVALQMIKPDFGKLKQCAARAILVTAPSEEADFVYRFFAPKMGIDEDPATGSAQCSLIPYWSARLNKNSLNSIQLSKRKGYLKGELIGNRVEISGKAVLYMRGEIEV
ncbi:PhzF family phenazine biosynthesis protein [soil metagenome]